jgi:hypothetical protein
MPSVKQFSIGGVVGIGIGLVGMGIQWKYPEQGWLGKWVAILGAAIVAIAIIASIVRWVTIKEFEKQQQPAQPFRPMAYAEAYTAVFIFR